MWSYYGSKSKVVDLYPAPLHTKIIEPFAGSARYALKYFDHDVLLIEKDELLVKLWLWLQQCSPKDIIGLPSMKQGENTDNFNFDCQEAKWLMGFIIQGGVNFPRKTVSSVGNFGLRIEPEKKRIAESLYKIKHWKIVLGSYEDAMNDYSTWFIDPPYIDKGKYYRQSSKNINFDSLSKWCRSRRGQVIVCENLGANWLPFKSLKEMRGSQKMSTEAMWYHE